MCADFRRIYAETASSRRRARAAQRFALCGWGGKAAAWQISAKLKFAARPDVGSSVWGAALVEVRDIAEELKAAAAADEGADKSAPRSGGRKPLQEAATLESF